MTKDELKQAAADAWQCVLAHPAADIKNYLMGQGIEFKGTVKPAPACCPLCQKKNCFGLLPGKEGGWLYKCHVPTCEGFKSGGIARFVEIQNRVDWKTARSMLHELTGMRRNCASTGWLARRPIPSSIGFRRSSRTSQRRANTRCYAWKQTEPTGWTDWWCSRIRMDGRANRSKWPEIS